MHKSTVSGFFRECSNLECAFRYPDLKTDSETAYCPKCGSLAPISCRISSISENHLVSNNNIQIIPLLDNIRSVYNVGSIIRTCDGLGIKEIILSGITPSPDHPRINKTSLGAIPNLKWHYANNGLHEIKALKANGFQIFSLESSQTALSIEKVVGERIRDRICLVVGNENLGVDPEIQKLSDLIIAIPMAGEKESFNVAVAFAIAAYHFVTFA